MRTERVETPAVDPIDAAAAAVLDAERDLAFAKDAEAKALRAYDLDATKSAQAKRATMARERCERIHATRLEELDAVGRAADQAERERKGLAVEGAVVRVEKWTEALWPEIRCLVKLDREIAPSEDRIAYVVARGERDYEFAMTEGETVQMAHVVQRRISRPTMAFASLLVRVAITRDRAARARGPSDGWVQSEVEPRAYAPERAAWEQANRIIEALEKGTKS
jgi:hypothetical protein